MRPTSQEEAFHGEMSADFLEVTREMSWRSFGSPFWADRVSCCAYQIRKASDEKPTLPRL